MFDGSKVERLSSSLAPDGTLSRNIPKGRLGDRSMHVHSLSKLGADMKMAHIKDFRKRKVTQWYYLVNKNSKDLKYSAVQAAFVERETELMFSVKDALPEPAMVCSVCTFCFPLSFFQQSDCPAIQATACCLSTVAHFLPCPCIKHCSLFIAQCGKDFSAGLALNVHLRAESTRVMT